MIRPLFLWISIAVSSGLAQRPSNVQQTWFPDGTGLEVHAEATGSTHMDAPRGATGAGYFKSERVDRVFRVVGDRDDNALIGYFLEAYRNTQTDTTVIRISPLDQATAADMLKSLPLGFKSATGRIPTVSAVREFPSVKIGQAATLDILYNPATGEKVYDVLRPITGTSACPTSMCVTAMPVPPRLSLSDIAVRVNGQAMSAITESVIGKALRIDVPGRGAYVIAASDPKGASRKFYPNVSAGGKSLKWSIDGDQIEIVSQANVGVDGIIWVYHDPNFRSQDQPGVVSLQAADTVEELLPKN
jgi:hypothetical protein